MKNKIMISVLAIFLIAVFVSGCVPEPRPVPNRQEQQMPTFANCDGIEAAFEEYDVATKSQRGWGDMLLGGVAELASDSSTGAPSANEVTHSDTNVQVEGVDEADIVKTDGNYIYTLSDGNLVIVDAYPADDAEVESITDLDELSPREMFIHGDNVLIFGSVSRPIYSIPERLGRAMQEAPSYYSYTPVMAVQIWDVDDKDDPVLVREVEFEGNYLTARKIGEKAYFVVNSYPYYRAMEGDVILPSVRDSNEGEEFKEICACDDVGYLPPIQARSFVTIASIDMGDVDSEIESETVVASGQNVYASLENLYLAEVNYNWGPVLLDGGENSEETIIHKFELNDGDVDYLGNMEAPGHILNQFSMDEYDNHFRIATTIGRVARNADQATSMNNVYIFDEDFEMVGALEGLAPGEQIYSARFMGEKGYLVTFRKVDPLFVIDLSDPMNPKLLGKLKIPGYSDYLHPIDENHLIGIGKEAIEAEEGDFSWYQGVKIAIFDVSDVNNPIEMYKEEIGDRGTDSEVLRDHKAFLFDKDRELMVLPIRLAEYKTEPTQPWEQGEFVYQGAYVYNVNLDDGFDLLGRITHHEEGDIAKLGYYYYGSGNAVKRSLYIGDVLYTISDNKIKANDLDGLDEISELVIGEDEPVKYYYE